MTSQFTTRAKVRCAEEGVPTVPMVRPGPRPTSFSLVDTLDGVTLQGPPLSKEQQL